MYCNNTEDHSTKLHVRDPNFKYPNKQIPKQGKEEINIFAASTNSLEVPITTSSGLKA